MSDYRTRKVTSRGTPSYQLGHYEMQGPPGKRRSVFKVDVHMGEHAITDEALTVWPGEIARLDATRPKQADKLRAKLDRLKELTCQ